MRLYRVHPWDRQAKPEEPYGPLYVPPGQGFGRWDNPDLYELRYFSTTPEGAVAETFGALPTWSPAMLRFPGPPSLPRALSTYELPDDARIADLADTATLARLNVTRVTDVSQRDKRRTQRLAAAIFTTGDWDGISWWSYYHPTITLVATWRSDGLELIGTEELSCDHDAVRTAADLIVRRIR